MSVCHLQTNVSKVFFSMKHVETLRANGLLLARRVSIIYIYILIVSGRNCILYNSVTKYYLLFAV